MAEVQLCALIEEIEWIASDELAFDANRADPEINREWRNASVERGEAFAPFYVLPHNDDRVIVTTKEDTWVEHLGTRTSYMYQLEAFASAVRNGAPVLTDADDALATMELIDACYRSAGMTPRPVSTI